MKLFITVALFVFAIVWVCLMGGVAAVSGYLSQGGGLGFLDAKSPQFEDDGSVKAVITNLDKQKFRLTLSLKVTDKKGKILGGLAKDNFYITEDGKRVPLKKFTPAGQAPIRACLVIDSSKSMNRGKLKGAQDGALAFLAMLRDDTDYLGVILFDNKAHEVLTMAPLNPTRRRLAVKAIKTIKLKLWTVMYRGMEKALARLEKIPGKRVIVVLTDGRDTTKPPAVRRNLVKKIVKEAQYQGIPFYMISLGNNADKKGMDKLAQQTFGKHLHAPTPDKLEDVYRNIGKSLQDEYTLVYESPNPIEDGLARNVAIAVQRGSVGTTAKTSFNVPGVIATGAGQGSSPSGDGEQASSPPFLIVFLPLAFLLGCLFSAPYLISFVRGNTQGPQLAD